MRSPEKFTLSLFTLILLLTACGQREPSPVASDADIQQKLVGTWIKEMNLDDGVQVRSVTVFRPDGSYAGKGTIVESNKTQWASEAGTFLVRGGVLILTMTKHSSTNARLPVVTRDRMVRLDDRELVMQSEERPDLEVTFRRQR